MHASLLGGHSSLYSRGVGATVGTVDGMTAAGALAFAQRIEKHGYGALWTPESRGRNVLVNAACLLAGTSKLIVASGIANIWPAHTPSFPICMVCSCSILTWLRGLTLALRHFLAGGLEGVGYCSCVR